jgi:hypothetical protein
MKISDYLEAVLRDQTLPPDGDELKSLRTERKNVEALLRREFAECAPNIRYGGSMAKKTMIRKSYDLDLPTYFGRDDAAAGETLREIHENVRVALEKEYFVTPKTSALRLRPKDSKGDFHIDVVPGRFVDGEDGDVFIHQAQADKERLRTNLDTHIEHIRDSGVVDAIRLVKLWRERNGLGVKTFVLELLVVDLLKNKKGASLEKQLVHVWTEFRDRAASLKVEDPANPTGNDLSSYLDSVRSPLASVALVALENVVSEDWQAIFGYVEEEETEKHLASLGRVEAGIPTRERPWCRGQ